MYLPLVGSIIVHYFALAYPLNLPCRRQLVCADTLLLDCQVSGRQVVPDAQVPLAVGKHTLGGFSCDLLSR